jgi:sugar diacid utilization regulator
MSSLLQPNTSSVSKSTVSNSLPLGKAQGKVLDVIRCADSTVDLVIDFGSLGIHTRKCFTGKDAEFTVSPLARYGRQMTAKNEATLVASFIEASSEDLYDTLKDYIASDVSFNVSYNCASKLFPHININRIVSKK